MRKSFFAFLYAALPALAFLTACDPVEPKTRLDFVAGTNLTSGNRTLPGGEIITTSLFARSTSASNKLKRIIISRTYDTLINNPVVYLDSAFDAEEFGMSFVIGTRSFQNGKVRSKEYWDFTLLDEQGGEYRKQYTLVTTFNNPNPNLNTFSSYYYNRNAWENIRYVATKGGLAFPAYMGRNHTGLQPDLDFYFGEDPRLALHLNGLNGTLFRSTGLTAADFNAVANATHLKNQYDNAQAEADRQRVAPNSVIAFKTGQGKVGLIQFGAFEIARDTLSKENVLRRVPYNVKVEK